MAIVAQSQGVVNVMPPPIGGLALESGAGLARARFPAVGGASHYGMQVTHQQTGQVHSTGPLGAGLVTQDGEVLLVETGLPSGAYDATVIAADSAADIPPAS